MSIKADIKKVINLIKKGWARNCLFRDKGNREINVGAGSLSNLIKSSKAIITTQKNKKNISKCCLEGAIYLASKNPIETQKYLEGKLLEYRNKNWDDSLAGFNDSCSDKRQVLRFLEKTV